MIARVYAVYKEIKARVHPLKDDIFSPAFSSGEVYTSSVYARRIVKGYARRVKWDRIVYISVVRLVNSALSELLRLPTRRNAYLVCARYVRCGVDKFFNLIKGFLIPEFPHAVKRNKLLRALARLMCARGVRKRYIISAHIALACAQDT